MMLIVIAASVALTYVVPSEAYARTARGLAIRFELPLAMILALLCATALLVAVGLGL